MRQSARAVANAAKIIAAFDFDGTITIRDTFLPFLAAAFGWGSQAEAIMRVALDVVGRGARMRSRDVLKARLIAILFAGHDCGPVDAAARDFAIRVARDLLRPAALERVRWHRERGHRLVLISASLDIYLTHLVGQLGFDDLLCTRLSRMNGIFDGRLVGRNCRGAEKVARLNELLDGCNGYQIYAYGNSAGDRELLRAADFAFYRCFHG